MAENKEYMIHQEEDGAIQISEDVVASIASTTASEVEGVSAMMGGSVGGILGMAAFHHKTRHWYFRMGLPVIFLLQAAAAVYLAAR